MLPFLQSRWRGKSTDSRRIQDRSRSPFAQSPETSRHRAVGQSVDGEEESYGDEDDNLLPPRRPNHNAAYFDQIHEEDFEEEAAEEHADDDEDGEDDAIDTPLLPIFSAPHLDRLPLYNITHAIRILIVQKCETTLSWDQLRSPQISQFLVKPIQSQVRTNHFNRATICALIANCLQFQKEGQLRAGNIGVSRTRALISELLAMRLIKEFTTRELIDALSYDFDPLQGMMTSANGTATPLLRDIQGQKTQARAARVSTIEIAIRAQAKRFLAHPLVVQHLEAIWAGTIVFHSEADNLHRKPYDKPAEERRGRRATGGGYGTVEEHSPSALPADAVLSRKARDTRVARKPAAAAAAATPLQGRRSVTLYDPRDASLFKLSRLRVPRYRQVLNTLSLAVMLGLFLAVLVDRSLYITPLEVLFWFWSAGYMLDEVVGFSEQGFGLYMLSFWNAFDLGILLLFVVYYCLRLYGIVLADQGKHHIAGMAYDVLASTAVLLFPRLFSVLDHYRYFSQLLIAFRLMVQDLMAILILIIICCSGFFVAFTLSFSDETTDGKAVAFALFQIVMGFSPAAWDKWAGYNMLGKTIMGMFLIICHFLIVTILITVLTNSFMAIVKNAEEEHQFLFAVNAISMVKSDALFSYIAPTNVIGWTLSPLRHVVPFRQYVKFNRTIIKVTHFPILFVIFGYERIILSSMAYEPTDLIEKPAISQPKPLAFSINKAREVFSPGRRLREPSVISLHKNQALEEVFRKPYRGDTVRTTTRDMMGSERRNSTDAVDKWMQVAENEGGASPPMEQPRSVLDRLETRKPKLRRAATADRTRSQQPSRNFSTASKSVVSEREGDLLSFTDSRRPPRIEEEAELVDLTAEPPTQETDADGDDENNGDSDHGTTPGMGESALSVVNRRPLPTDVETDDEYFRTPIAPGKSPLLMQMPSSSARPQRFPESSEGIPQSSSRPTYQGKAAQALHSRNASSATILFAPQQGSEQPAAAPARGSRAPTTARNSAGTATPTGTGGVLQQALPSGQRTPRSKQPLTSKPRPVLPGRQKTAPGGGGGGGGAGGAVVGLSFIDLARRQPPQLSATRKPSFNARALDLASEIGDNKWGPSFGIDGGGISGMPASFSEQMMREREVEQRRVLALRWREAERAEERRRGEDERRRGEEAEEKGRVGRIMLARMNTLEEGFREVLREVRGLTSSRGERGGGEVDVVGGKGVRGADDVVGVAGAGLPRTRGGRGAGEARARRSPRKVGLPQRRGTKGKEVQGLHGGQRQGSSFSSSSFPSWKMENQPPESPESVVGLSAGGAAVKEEEQEVRGAAVDDEQRPSTAVHTPEARGRAFGE
ncbi:hypothetical protein B0A50_00407 [Salinomyces thailandicus]|uniref:Uncharacterized protein n=1 Tax=Salinomyces thailandicus TaxID=706561 RepID=A0A4U0UDI7_9PEZI|nr:hypothetical protein B0A50_00407 [Salinomyces thailandica]